MFNQYTVKKKVVHFCTIENVTLFNMFDDMTSTTLYAFVVHKSNLHL